MIIRSQDKCSITDDVNISICKERPSTIGDYNGENIYTKSGVFLGHYSTEEKAVKVLDMICEFANGIHFEKVATEQCGKLDGAVFNMPQDSEV